MVSQQIFVLLKKPKLVYFTYSRRPIHNTSQIQMCILHMRRNIGICTQQWLSNVHSGIGYICARIQVNKMENPKLSYYSSQTTSMDISLAYILQPLVLITMTIFANDLPTQNCTMIKLAWHIIQILILSSHCVAFSMIMEKSNMFG